MTAIQTRWLCSRAFNFRNSYCRNWEKLLLVFFLANCRCNVGNANRFATCHLCRPSLSLKSLKTHWVRCSGNLCIATHSFRCTGDKRHDPFLRYLNTLHVPNSFIYAKQTTGVSCVRATTLHAYRVTVTVNPVYDSNELQRNVFS